VPIVLLLECDAAAMTAHQCVPVRHVACTARGTTGACKPRLLLAVHVASAGRCVNVGVTHSVLPLRTSSSLHAFRVD
jgi:hypothetical protein